MFGDEYSTIIFLPFPISDFPYSLFWEISSKTVFIFASLFTKKFKYPPAISTFVIMVSSNFKFSFISFAITGGAFLKVFASLKHGKA